VVKTVRQLIAGYLLTFITPEISLLFYATAIMWSSHSSDFLTPIIVLTSINIVVTILIIAGLALYVYGHVRHQMTDQDAGPTLLISIMLIFWGIFVTMFALGIYGELIKWSQQPQVRELTSWDYLQYITWILKATLWNASGFIFATTAIMHKRKSRRRNKLSE
jgi:uncharacterized membrane protein YbhN (UPF0104 family)